MKKHAFIFQKIDLYVLAVKLNNVRLVRLCLIIGGTHANNFMYIKIVKNAGIAISQNAKRQNAYKENRTLVRKFLNVNINVMDLKMKNVAFNV